MYSVIQDSSTLNGFAKDSIKQILIDSEDDLSSLPECSPGSFAYTADMNTCFILSNSKVWTKVGE